MPINITLDKGEPAARRGHKATGLDACGAVGYRRETEWAGRFMGGLFTDAEFRRAAKRPEAECPEAECPEAGGP